MIDSRKIFAVTYGTPYPCLAYLVNYEPAQPSRKKMVKSFNPDYKVGDYVVVETDTRHEFTVVKVTDIKVEADIDDEDLVRWIVGGVAMEDHQALLAKEQLMLSTLKKASKSAAAAKMQKQMEDELGADVMLSLPKFGE